MNTKFGLLVHVLLKKVGFGAGKEKRVIPTVENIQDPLDEYSAKALLALSIAAQAGLQIEPLKEVSRLPIK